jgi:hypothetical protein
MMKFGRIVHVKNGNIADTIDIHSFKMFLIIEPEVFVFINGNKQELYEQDNNWNGGPFPEKCDG